MKNPVSFLITLVLATTLFASGAKADTNIEAVPTGWRLQDYIGATTTNVVAWYTGSSCSQGQLTFSTSATADDKNRFWSMIITAKATGRTIGVFYDASGTCQITSFYEA